MKAVLLDADTLGSDIDITPLHNCFEGLAVYNTDASETTMQRLAGASVVLSNKVSINRADLEANPSIQCIVVLATGFNIIDIAAATELNVTVCNIRDYSTPSVIQHTLLLILALLARLPGHHRAIAEGEWQRHTSFCLIPPAMTELSGKTVLIVGYGALGEGVERILRVLGANVLIAARPLTAGVLATQQDGRVPLDDGLVEADIVTIHCQLSEQTAGLFNERRLALMKPSALLINTARGGIVDEAALAKALENNDLAGAGLDVLSEEPPREGSPLLDLLSAADQKDEIVNLIVTAHCAWATVATRQRLLVEAVKVVKAFQAGQPVNQVNA